MQTELGDREVNSPEQVPSPCGAVSPVHVAGQEAGGRLSQLQIGLS
jgi:hypothetical protein